MSETKFTPGPWELEGPYRMFEAPTVWQVYNKLSPFWVAWIQHAEYKPEESTANANLIAAAPEMLDALKNAVEGLDMAINRFRKMGIMEEADRYFPYLHEADAAIAKAEGRQ